MIIIPDYDLSAVNTRLPQDNTYKTSTYMAMVVLLM